MMAFGLGVFVGAAAMYVLMRAVHAQMIRDHFPERKVNEKG